MGVPTSTLAEVYIQNYGTETNITNTNKTSNNWIL
jgi:hypothetical protein